MEPLLLVVDDSPDMGNLVCRLSRRAGVTAVHRSAVEDGWAALQEQRPDLLMLDMRLPALREGADLCRRVRAAPAFADLRVALFVNISLEEDIASGLEAGADLVFAKDLLVEPDEWRQRLAAILAWTHGRVWRNLVAWRAEQPWPTPPADWQAVFNQALQQALARHSNGQVPRILLRRAVASALAHDNRPEDAHTWLHAHEAMLERPRSTPACGPEFVALLAASFVEQVWCVFGSRDSAAIAAALAPVVPGLPESCC
jgi:DNA-binding response OmpR family regulator